MLVNHMLFKVSYVSDKCCRSIGGMTNTGPGNQSISTVYILDMSGTNIIRLTMIMTIHLQRLYKGINLIFSTRTS
jgi:hypothetical protein